MSIVNDAIDYNHPPNLTWKLPLKPAEMKTVEFNFQQPMEKTIAIQLTDSLNPVSNLNCQILHAQKPEQTNCVDHIQVQLEDPILYTKPVIENCDLSAKPLKKTKVKPTNKKKSTKISIDGTLYHSQQLGLKVPPKQSLGIKGKIIHKQAREVINNVFKFMKDEAQNGIRVPIANYRERVLKATGISKCTYSKITLREFQRGEPQPTRKKKNVNTTQEPVATETDSIYRPKINRDAVTPDGVYNLEDLVEAYILDSLAVDAGQIIETGSADEFGFFPFPTSNINKILNSDASEEEKIRRITIFMYINYLIKFMTTPMKSITKKFVVCDRSEDVNKHILNVFSEIGQSGRTRPLHMKDKALCYSMILAAIAMDFEVDVQLLSKDLKIGLKKAVEVARILAFNAKSNNKSVVQLKLPLPAPVKYSIKRKVR